MMLKIVIIILYASGVIGIGTSKQTFDTREACEKERVIDTAKWQGLIDMKGEPGRVRSACMTDEEFKAMMDASGLEDKKGRDDSI